MNTKKSNNHQGKQKNPVIKCQVYGQSIQFKSLKTLTGRELVVD